MSKAKEGRELRALLGALDKEGRYIAARDTAKWQRSKARGRHVGRLVAATSNHDVKDRQRLGLPIQAFVGPNGGGKTVCAVKTLRPWLERGGRVVSNLPLWNPDTEVPWPGFELLEDYDQLVELENCVVLLDEIVANASSRASSNLPFQVEYLLQTLRHSNVRVMWTAPSPQRADVILREVTQYLTECRGMLADKGLAVRAREAGDEVPLWAPKRLFRFSTYDFMEFSEWSKGKKDRIRPFANEWWWGPGSDAFRSYDSLGQVVRVAESNESGRCLKCGGTRRPKPCTCGTVERPSRRHGRQPVEMRDPDMRDYGVVPVNQ